VLFAGKYLLGLGTLPWFLFNPNGTLIDTPNFITRTDESLDFLVAVFKALVDRNNPFSLLNCLCLLINNGFPVPPIGCPTCQVVALQDESILEPNPSSEGFGRSAGTQRGAPRTREERYREIFPYGRLMAQSPDEQLFDPYSILNDVFGYRQEWDINHKETAGLRMTPLRYYKPPDKLKNGYNPFVISQIIWANYDAFQGEHGGSMKSFFNAKETRTFVQKQKTHIMDHWRSSATCKTLQRDQYAMHHSAKMSEEQRQEYYEAYKSGKFEPLSDGTCPSNTYDRSAERQDQSPRFTLFPTNPAVSECGNVTLGIPLVPCYDLCCVVRRAIELLVHVVSLVARFFNGLIQGQDPNNILPGEPAEGFGYFTGTYCNRDAANIKPCFESDIIILVRAVVLPLKCLCEFINIIIPVVPSNPRGDLCCSIQRVGELVACIVQLLVNAINALAMGAEDNVEDPGMAFAYYKMGEFQRDIARVFVVVEGVAECICVFVRGIFPGNFFAEFTETIDFDPCCFIESILGKCFVIWGAPRVCGRSARVWALRACVGAPRVCGRSARVWALRACVGAPRMKYIFFLRGAPPMRGALPMRGAPPPTHTHTRTHTHSHPIDAVINIVQLVINIVISLATLASGSPESYCYWRIDADRCVGMADFGPGTLAPNGTITTVGFVQDVIMVLDALLPDSNTACYTNCMGNDPGMGGVIPCVCQIINALVPVRRDPSRPVNCLVNTTGMNFPTNAPTLSPTQAPTVMGATQSPTRSPTLAPTSSPTLGLPVTSSPTEDPMFPTTIPPVMQENDLNCMIIDFCCPIVKTGFALKAGVRFAVEAFASIWQSWDPGYPEFFTAYIFCNEAADNYELPEGWGTFNGTTPGDSSTLITPMDPTRGTFKCGKLKPVIQALIGADGLINRCLCEYFQLLGKLFFNVGAPRICTHVLAPAQIGCCHSFSPSSWVPMV